MTGMRRSAALLLASLSLGMAHPPPETAVTVPVSVPAPEPEPQAVTLPPLSATVWGRAAAMVRSTDDPADLDDVTRRFELTFHLFGRVVDHVSIRAGIAATDTGETRGVAILDIIGQVAIADALNVWVGRMIAPTDRSNLSGTWFMAPWAYPGSYGAGGVASPRMGPFGRSDGATIWGQVGGGVFKYYLGAFDLGSSGDSMLLDARINLALLSPEPGYVNKSCYYGKDLLAIGLDAQFDDDGSVKTDPMSGMVLGRARYAELGADVLFEKDLGRAGVLDLEGAAHLFSGDYEAFDWHAFALASWLVPGKIGIGRLQPLVRFQSAERQNGDVMTTTEAQLGYVIAPYSARAALVYSHTDTGGSAANAVIAGLQLQK